MINNKVLFNGDLTSGKIVLFAWDPLQDWKVLAVSSSIFPVFGFTPKDIYEGVIVYADLIHPDDIEKVRMEVDYASRKGKSEFTHEIYRIKDAEGHYRHVYDHTKIIRDEQDQILEYHGYISDETEMVTQNKRMELVLSGTGLGMWDWYPQTNKVVFNEEWAKMLGYKLSEVAPNLDSWESKVHPNDIEACFIDIQNHIEGVTDFYQNIHRMMHKNGKWRYILDRGRIVEKDINGAPLRFTGTHTDITELKQAQEKLEIEKQTSQRLLSETQALSKRYKTFLQLSSEAVFVICPNTGKLLEYSRIAQDFLGYNNEEMTKLTVYDWDNKLTTKEFTELTTSLCDYSPPVA